MSQTIEIESIDERTGEVKESKEEDTNLKFSDQRKEFEKEFTLVLNKYMTEMMELFFSETENKTQKKKDNCVALCKILDSFIEKYPDVSDIGLYILRLKTELYRLC